MTRSDEYKRKFREGFNGKKDDPSDYSGENSKKKKSKKTKLESFLSKMTPEERAERERKIKEQSSAYEDGGVCEKKSYFEKLKKKLKK